MATQADIANALRKLGTNGQLLIIEFGLNYYMQFGYPAYNQPLNCEAVSHAFLPEDDWLEPPALERLESLGWKTDQPHRNYYQFAENSTEVDHQRLAQLVVQTASEVYDCEQLHIAALEL